MKVFYNGIVRTMDRKLPEAEAFAVEDGRFLCVGSTKEVKAYALKNGHVTDQVDLAGKLVIPAFNDSHMHFIHMAKSLFSVDLVGTRSISELKQRMAEGLQQRKPQPGAWLEGEGWNHDFFEDEIRFPTRFDLDEVTTEVPLLIMRACFHIGVLNTPALKLMGLTEESAAQYGSLVGRTEDGGLNGVIKESLLDDIKAKISVLHKDLIKELVINAQDKLFAEGITSVQSDDIGYMPGFDYDLFFTALSELEAEGRLKIRLGEQALLQEKSVIQAFFNKGYHYGGVTARARLTSIKLLSDGSLGARTAALRKPYADDGSTTGLLMFAQNELDELVLTAHKNHCPTAIHAIGDKAIESALDAIEKAQKAMPEIKLRHGIVHCQVTDERLLDRFRELDVLALVQPVFIDYDMNIVEDRLGRSLAATSYAWKSLADRGVHVSFGTDCPVESYKVMPNLYSAVTRKNITGNGKKVYRPEERMSVAEAVFAYTWEGAYASGEEAVKGSISCGKVADFAVLDRNLFEISENEILSTKVVGTYADGEPVYLLRQDKATTETC